MDTNLTEIYNRLQAMHRAIDRALEGLPDEALDWSPGPDMNSLGVLLAHTLGAERYWIGDVAMGLPSDRDRDAEFRTAGVSASAFARQAQETLAHNQAVLSQLTTEQFGEERVAPLFGQRVTVAHAVLHALEHTALHAGHIEITRQLWDQHGAGGRNR